MNYPKLTFLALPYARLELPGWGKLLKKISVISYKDDEYWQNAHIKTIPGKLHGYLMNLDLSNWSERHTYFIGRF
ncbi:hypothetical protein [Gloeothece verrucosa]|nr:hypothetical protein [Gloeothece verrucosa]